MKIIKQGNIDHTEKEFACNECKCEFVANAKEYSRCAIMIEIGTHEEIPVFETICPCCGAKVQRTGR